MVVTAWLAGENLIMRDRQLPSFESYARLLKTIYLWRDSYGHHRQYSEGFGYRLGIARHAQGRHARTGANYCDRKAGARHGHERREATSAVFLVRGNRHGNSAFSCPAFILGNTRDHFKSSRNSPATRATSSLAELRWEVAQ